MVHRNRGEERLTAAGEPFFCFHHVNAWDDGDDVVVDLVAFEDPSVIDALYIDRLRAGPQQPRTQLRRYRLKPDGTAEGEVLLDHTIELPRIDYARANGRPHRFVYAAGSAGHEWFDEVVKFDGETRSMTAWSEAGCYPGEPVFVGRPDREREDDGVVLSVVFDSRTERSFLLVLDAASFTEIARAAAPHHVPHSFHGQFFG